MAHSINYPSYWQRAPLATAPPFTFAARVNFSSVPTVFPCVFSNSVISAQDNFSLLFYQGSSFPIVTTVGPSLVDSAGVVWALVATNGGQVTRNGVLIAYTGNVVLIAYYAGVIYQQNSAGNWYSFNPDGSLGTVYGTTSPIPSVAADGQFHDVVQTASTSDDTAKTSGFSMAINTWYTVSAVFASATSRIVSASTSTSSGTSVVNITPALTNLFTLGSQLINNVVSFFLNAVLAQPAIWSIALSQPEILQYHLGCSPRRLRPEALISYPWMCSDTSLGQDLCNSTNWAANGTPTLVANPQGFPP